MTAPIGAVVSLYVDLVEDVGSGDIIETGTGRKYRVLAVRLQTRGKNVGRKHLRAIVVEEDAVPDDTVFAGADGIQRAGLTHRIRWYRRERGAGVKERGRR